MSMNVSFYSSEKVILHPDLEGVPLLILANKQDKIVRLCSYTCTYPSDDAIIPGCSTTDRGGECF